MSAVTRIEQPCPGHFIAAHDCAFRRNTALVGQLRAVVVSTVGAYHYKDEIQSIGSQRWFETMVFAALKTSAPTCCNWRQVVDQTLDFACPANATDPMANDEEYSRQATEAQRQHEEMVAKWSHTLASEAAK